MKLTRSLFAIILLTVVAFTSYSQEKPGIFARYWNSLVNDTTDIRKPQFLVYPTLAYAPETSWEFGLSSLYVFYANRDTLNRLSEITGFTFFTLENQYGIWFDHALYSDKNKWFLLGRFRYQSFPLLFYGIGADSPGEYLARVDANQLLIKERVLRNLFYKNLYLGLELDFQRLSSVEFVRSEPGSSFALPRGNEGSANLGLGIGLIYDNRHNVLNVRHGLFSELAFLRYNDSFLSDYTFTSLVSDNRIYRPVGENNVFAAQLLGQFNFGEVPFNQLALMGGESMMRGYYTGRFRDKNQIAFQVEYRLLPLPFDFTKRWGAAFFGGMGNVFGDLGSIDLQNSVWSAGTGIRFLLFQKKDIFTRLDVAFTEEGTGFYLFIGEAF